MVKCKSSNSGLIHSDTLVFNNEIYRADVLKYACYRLSSGQFLQFFRDSYSGGNDHVINLLIAFEYGEY